MSARQLKIGALVAVAVWLLAACGREPPPPPPEPAAPKPDVVLIEPVLPERPPQAGGPE